MTIGTLRTQGTELWFINPLTSAADFVKLSCPTGISGLGGPADQLDDTCLDSTTRTFKQGLKNPGTLTVPFNFIPTNTSHQILFQLYDGGQVVQWIAGLSDGTSPPTNSSAGGFNPPPNRSSIRFNGYVSDINIDIATNSIVTGTLTIQRSGAILVTPGPAPTT
jgi:hypothetical protein